MITECADGIRTGQLGNIDALFAPSAIHIILDNMALHGWAEYRDDHLRPEMARFSDLRYAHTGIETSLRGNIAWTAFRWRCPAPGRGPSPYWDAPAPSSKKSTAAGVSHTCTFPGEEEAMSAPDASGSVVRWGWTMPSL